MINKAFAGAMRKGREAALEGKSEDTCPYMDHRKPDGRLTFSRAFIKAWLYGYRSTLKRKERDAQQKDEP